MDNELKQLIEDAAKLLGIAAYDKHEETFATLLCVFNPLDQERGDLWKVADAAGLWIDFQDPRVFNNYDDATGISFTKGDYQSQAIAVLRAASAVWKERQNAE